MGAILILAKPENREKLIYFMGIEKVRYRRPVHPGDVVEIEATVGPLRSRMGVLRGIARVGRQGGRGRRMTFALGTQRDGRAATSPTPARRPARRPRSVARAARATELQAAPVLEVAGGSR